MLRRDFTTGNDLFIPSFAYKIFLQSSPAQPFRYIQYTGQDAAAPYLLPSHMTRGCHGSVFSHLPSVIMMRVSSAWRPLCAVTSALLARQQMFAPLIDKCYSSACLSMFSKLMYGSKFITYNNLSLISS